MNILYYVFYVTLVVYVYSYTQRIGEGKEVDDPAKFPFFAMFIRDIRLSNGSIVTETCGGSLIHPQWILTVGHCLPNKTSEFETIILQDKNVIFMGSIYTPPNNRFAQAKRIIEIHRHPNYTYWEDKEGYIIKLLNDIALLKLKTPFKLSDTVDVIALATLNHKYEYGIAIGIGMTDWNQTNQTSNVVKYAKMEIRPVNDVYTNTSFITLYDPDYILYENGGYALPGDSGGPFICENVAPPLQIGIISRTVFFKNKANETIFVNVMERVTDHINFIKKHVPYIKPHRENDRRKSGTEKSVPAVLYLYIFLLNICII